MRFRSKTLLAAIAAATLLTATPALAFNWQCTAKNARGQKFTATAFGLFSAYVKQRAMDKAMVKCRAVSAVCHISGCVDLDS